MKKFINLTEKNMSKRIQGEVINVTPPVVDPFYTEDMIEDTAKQAIEEIKKIDKSKFFQPKPKKKISILDKILIIFGYGKKG